jgi:hypothetical protein
MLLTIRDNLRRLANGSMTISLARGNPEGTLSRLKTFMIDLQIEPFAEARTEAEFLAELDRHTDRLNARLIRPNWGLARKALNVFLFEISQHFRLRDAYGMGRIEPFLEVALDANVAGHIYSVSVDQHKPLPVWPGIKWLEPDVSRRYQEYAKEIVMLENLSIRADIEALYWTPELPQDEH